MSSTAIESRVRRLAARNGLCLSKSRRRNPYTDRATYSVSDPYTGGLVTYDVDLDEAEAHIRQLSQD